MALALAFVALAFVLLRPFCEIEFSTDAHSYVASSVAGAGHVSAEHSDGGDTPSGVCCDSVKDGTLAKPAALLVSWNQGGSLGVVLFAATGLLLFARPRKPARWLLAAPPSQSFYARSARILR